MKQTILPLILAAALAGAMASCNSSNEESSAAAGERVVKVKTITVGDHGAYDARTFSGTIEEGGSTTLSFTGGGTITAMRVSEGQSVARGQLIATIDARNVTSGAVATHAATEQAGDMVAQAQTMVNQAQDAYDRMKVLHDNGSLPEIKWVEVETKLEQAKLALSQAKSNAKAAGATENIATKSVSDTRLTAPVSGIVQQKLADAGQNVLPGAPVVKLVQIDKVKVTISVPENEISQISNGQSVAVTVAALGGRSFTGTVVEKSVSADPLSRSYAVKALVDNPGHALLPGMIAEVALGGTRSGLPTLPASIVQIDADNRPFVWRVVGGTARKTFVSLGANVGDAVQITGGLDLNDVVISEGQQKVSTGMKVSQ